METMLDETQQIEMNLDLDECDFVKEEDAIFSSPLSSPLQDDFYDITYSSGMPNDSLMLDDSFNDYYSIGTVFENEPLSFQENEPKSPESLSDSSKSVKNEDSLNPSKVKKRPRNMNKTFQRKKRRLNNGESDIHKITLSRDELLSFTSKQFEDYVQKLEHGKSLSGEEKKELKRQRRLIKNRESAQASRQRKKKLY